MLLQVELARTCAKRLQLSKTCEHLASDPSLRTLRFDRVATLAGVRRVNDAPTAVLGFA
jgi:hypothetical protein